MAKRRSLAGQATLELLVVVVTLLTLVVAAVDLGALVNGRAALTSAAREGARLGAADLSASDATLRATVLNAATTAGLAASRLGTPTVSYSARAGGTPITVTASYTVPLDPLLANLVARTISASATMRQQ
ncbi:MAG TPA: TadE/TadG family type IV pilus assembly protein [Armatimonadota bacterium]